MSNSNISFEPRKLDSDLLRTFLAIASTGSFSRGADLIFRSQSAASLQIKKLEEILQQTVFERHARGVVLTPVGDKLRPVAEQVVDLLDEVLGKLQSEALGGFVWLGIPDEIGKTRLPDIIAAFARANPLVDVEVQCGFSAHFRDALACGELDLAVLTVEEADTHSQVLMTERTLWVASQRHRTWMQDPLPIAVYNRTCWWRDRVLDGLEGIDRRYRIVYSSESDTGILAAIASGVAVGAVSESCLTEDHRVLSPEDGFPLLPDSILVLDYGSGPRSKASMAMAATICKSFEPHIRKH